MKNWFTDLISSSANVSAMRVMAFIALITAVIISFYAILCDKNLPDVAVIVGAFLGGAFGGKAVQSFSEPREPVRPAGGIISSDSPRLTGSPDNIK